LDTSDDILSEIFDIAEYEVMPCGIVKSKRFAYCVKLSVPYIVPKAHFTHEVRFTCEAYFTFRESGTLS